MVVVVIIWRNGIGGRLPFNEVFVSSPHFTDEFVLATILSRNRDFSTFIIRRQLVIVVAQTPLQEVLFGASIDTHFDITDSDTLILIAVILSRQREFDFVNTLHDGSEVGGVLQIVVSPGALDREQHTHK